MVSEREPPHHQQQQQQLGPGRRRTPLFNNMLQGHPRVFSALAVAAVVLAFAPCVNGQASNHLLRGANASSSSTNTPLNDVTIRDAVTAWCHDSGSAAGVYGKISAWDTSDVTDMSWLFAKPDFTPAYCSTYATFNEDLSKWNVSRVTDMGNMFKYASSFNSDISAWDVSRVTNMDRMFEEASSFNSDVSAWDVSRVTDMLFIFYEASNFAQHLCWDIPPSTGTDYIFTGTAGACIDKTCGSVSDSSLYC